MDKFRNAYTAMTVAFFVTPPPGTGFLFWGIAWVAYRFFGVRLLAPWFEDALKKTAPSKVFKRYMIFKRRHSRAIVASRMARNGYYLR